MDEHYIVGIDSISGQETIGNKDNDVHIVLEMIRIILIDKGKMDSGLLAFLYKNQISVEENYIDEDEKNMDNDIRNVKED